MKVFIKQISKFLIVGVSAVMVDLVTYYIFSSFLGIDISKALGFICGSVFTYYFNKIWTWRNKEKTNKTLVIRFAIIYGISFICNILINKYTLELTPDVDFSAVITFSDGNTKNLLSFKGDKFLAFFFATVFSAAFNFVGQKLWIFKQPSNITLSVEEED